MHNLQTNSSTSLKKFYWDKILLKAHLPVVPARFEIMGKDENHPFLVGNSYNNKRTSYQ